jgi:TolA-binding protein
VYTPSAADARKALARVRARIDRGEVVEDVQPAEERSRSGRWFTIGAVVFAVAATALVVSRLDLSSMLASEVEEGDPEAAYAQPESSEAGGEAIDRAPTGPRDARPEPAEPNLSREPDPTPEPEVAPEPETPKPKRRRNKTTRSADATLHAEMALLRPAQQALKSGNHRRALQLFDDHARSFPDSALAEERTLGRIEALCGLGRGAEARKVVASFGRRFPGSPYRAKAERACPEP